MFVFFVIAFDIGAAFHFVLEIKNNNWHVIKISSIDLLFQFYLFLHNVYCFFFLQLWEVYHHRPYFTSWKELNREAWNDLYFSLCSSKPGNFVKVKCMEMLHLFFICIVKIFKDGPGYILQISCVSIIYVETNKLSTPQSRKHIHNKLEVFEYW